MKKQDIMNYLRVYPLRCDYLIFVENKNLKLKYHPLDAV